MARAAWSLDAAQKNSWLITTSPSHIAACSSSTDQDIGAEGVALRHARVVADDERGPQVVASLAARHQQPGRTQLVAVRPEDGLQVAGPGLRETEVQEDAAGHESASAQLVGVLGQHLVDGGLVASRRAGSAAPARCRSARRAGAGPCGTRGPRPRARRRRFWRRATSIRSLTGPKRWRPSLTDAPVDRASSALPCDHHPARRPALAIRAAVLALHHGPTCARPAPARRPPGRPGGAGACATQRSPSGAPVRNSR